MAKTYVDIVKYLIRATIEVNGIVEKPDIVGAIFGQTEGLLGDELDLRELQKNGRIGRIEVDTNVRGGKCIGAITIPSSLDMVETSILAAALEIVDRVGPCEARIASQKIEDTRNLKRKQVLGRARELLKTMMMNEVPESKELSEMVRGELKVAEAVSYGAEGLTAGPEVNSSEEIVVVEGRADVLNLLRNGIKNCVAIGGANVGKTISDLCRKKEVTVFLDGDRGGDIILKELMHATEIDFVARAPSGMEVEELTRKEIIQALRRRAPVEQAAAGANGGGREAEHAEHRERRDLRQQRQQAVMVQPAQRMPGAERPVFQQPIETAMVVAQAPLRAPLQPAVAELVQREPPADPAAVQKLKGTLKELEGSLRARLVSPDGSTLEEVAIRDIMASLEGAKAVHAVVLDGIITQRLLDLAAEKGAKFVAGLRTGNIASKPAGISLVLSE